MALSSRGLTFTRKFVQTFTAMAVRPMAYKSSISLETIYPNSSLKLTTPSFSADPNEKFTGFIPMQKLTISYSASSGPGGQNVNKVHTKVDLRFKLSEADWLHTEVRDKMMELYKNKLNKEGYLVIKSDSTRSQQLNLAHCLQKLRNMVRDASVTRRQPAPETQEMIRQRHLKASRLRVAVKRERAQLRAARQPPTTLDL